MQTLSVRNVRVSVTARRPVSRKVTVVPKAITVQQLTDMVGNAFVRIFSKPQSNVERFAENHFAGKIVHHERARRPFRDGFSNAPPAPAAVERNDVEAESYLQGAVNRVANHAFVGDETEPKSFGLNDGFTGKIHSGRGAEREGFHSKKH